MKKKPKKNTAIPIIYYHSIANQKKKSPWSFLSYPIDLFEAHMKYLRKKGFTFLFMNDVYEIMKTGNYPSSKVIAIHFDDGFLDNWVFAFPILKKYHIKATIYVNPEFADTIVQPRPTMEDVIAGSIRYDDLDWWGYLSWNEMKIMEESGLIDIQSHSLTHTWYFSGNSIIDFHHPNDHYYWLFWNKFPKKKPVWLSEIDHHTFELGRPVYENGKSITIKKYYEDETLKSLLIKFVNDNGAGRFFDNPNWKTILYEQVNSYKKKNTLNERFETEEEYCDRVRYELAKSKKLIEQHLNKQIDFLCWPGGGQNSTSFDIAYKVGYKSTTKGNNLNKFGGDPRSVSRVAANINIKIPVFQKWFDLMFLHFQIIRGQGGLVSKSIGNILKKLFLK